MTTINNNINIKTFLTNNLFIIGQYLQITIPYDIILTSYKLQGVFDKVIPTSWYICGSNDGILFNVLDYQNLTTLSKISVTNFTILKTNISLIPYNIIRIIITATTDDRNTFAIGKFIIRYKTYICF